MLLGLTKDEYHAREEYSNSKLSCFAKSPRRYHAQFIAKTIPPPAGKALDMGTVGHAAILEPHIIGTTCVRIPKEVLNADGHKRGKAWLEYQEAMGDTILLSDADYADVLGMFEAVYSNEYAASFLRSPGFPEANIIWEAEGAACRSRVDRLLPDYVVDIKTTRDASPRAFERSIAEYRYHQQAAFYLDAAKHHDGKERKFIFIAVESTAPYRVGVHQIASGSVAAGRATYLDCIKQIQQRTRTGEWNDWFERRINMVSLPTWNEEPILENGE